VIYVADIGGWETTRAGRLMVVPIGRHAGRTVGNWADLAAHDASLGVDHVWTATGCVAYHTYNPSDCTCGKVTT